MTFDAVIFDCDGVLVDSEILGLEDCTSYLRGHGLDYSASDLVRLFTGLRDDIFSARLITAYRKANGRNPPTDFFDGLIEQRRKRRHELQPVPGASEALKALPYARAVASSSRAVFLESKLKRTGLWELVEPHVYSGELVAHGKPAPDIFLYAAEKLGVAPTRCLVVEDSAHGVEAGRAAGMAVCGFLGGGHCFEGHGERLASTGADWTVSDFAELISELKRRA